MYFLNPNIAIGTSFEPACIKPSSLPQVLKEDLYEKLLHGIEEVGEDLLDDSVERLSEAARDLPESHLLKRGTRVSLTIRRVKKVSKIKLRL